MWVHRFVRHLRAPLFVQGGLSFREYESFDPRSFNTVNDWVLVYTHFELAETGR